MDSSVRIDSILNYWQDQTFLYYRMLVLGTDGKIYNGQKQMNDPTARWSFEIEVDRLVD